MTKKKMTCKKCGCSLQADWKICPVCSFSAVKAEETIPQENMPLSKTPENNTQNYSGNEKLFIFVFLLSVFVVIITNETFNLSAREIIRIAFVVAGISIVIGFIKYPENKVIKIIFYFFLISVITYSIQAFLVTLICYQTFV